MCSEPVTFGGGMTMENGGLSLVGVRREVAGRYPLLVPPLLYLARLVLGGEATGGPAVGSTGLGRSVTRQVYGGSRGCRCATDVRGRGQRRRGRCHARPMSRPRTGTADVASRSTLTPSRQPIEVGDEPVRLTGPERPGRPAADRSPPSRTRMIVLSVAARGRASPAPRCSATPAGGSPRRRTPRSTAPPQVGRADASTTARRAQAPPTTCARRSPPTSTWTRRVGAVYTDPAGGRPQRALLRRYDAALDAGAATWTPLFDLIADDQGAVDRPARGATPATLGGVDEVRHDDRGRAATSRSAAGPTTAAWRWRCSRTARDDDSAELLREIRDRDPDPQLTPATVSGHKTMWPTPVGVGHSLMVDVRRRPTLPHPPECSTIGAGGLSFRVRNVTGRFPSAMTAVTSVNSTTTPDTRGCSPVSGVCSFAVNRTVDA